MGELTVAERSEVFRLVVDRVGLTDKNTTTIWFSFGTGFQMVAQHSPEGERVWFADCDSLSAQPTEKRKPAVAEAPVDPAAVLLLTQKAALPEPEARSLAATLTRIGGTIGNIRHAVDVMLGKPGGVANRGGFLRRAVEAAVAGNPYLLPTPAAAHASDRGERPQRPVVRAPKAEKVKQSKTPEPILPHTQSAWEKLDEAAQHELLAIAQPRVEATLPALVPQIRRGGKDGGPHVLVLKLAQQLAEEQAQKSPDGKPGQ